MAPWVITKIRFLGEYDARTNYSRSSNTLNQDFPILESVLERSARFKDKLREESGVPIQWRHLQNTDCYIPISYPKGNQMVGRSSIHHRRYFVDYIMAEMANDASWLDADYEGQLRKELGVDKPIYVQYLSWMKSVLRSQNPY